LKKQFVINLALVLAINILIKPLWVFGIDLSVQNTLGAQAYGVYFSLFNFTLIFNVLLDMGLTNFTNRHVSRYAFLAGKYLSNVAVIRLILGLLYTVFMFAAAWFLNYPASYFKLLTYLSINQFLLSLILYFRANIAGLQLLTLDSLLSIADRVLMIFFAGILLIFFKPYFTIELFVQVQTLAYALTALAVFFILKRKIGLISFRFKPLYAWVIIKRSLPFALLTILMAAYSRADAVLLINLLPDGELQAGMFARAYRIPEAFAMIPFLFAGLLLPIFSKMLKNNQNTDEIVHTSVSLLLVPMGIFACTAAVWSSEIMQFLYPDEVFAQSSLRFFYLILSLIPISLNYIFGTLLTAAGKLKTLNYIALLALTINLALNFLLIPTLKSDGAALVSLLTNTLAFVLQVGFSVYYFGAGLYVKKMIYSVVFLAATCLATLLIKISGTQNLYVPGLLMLLYLVVAIFTKIINLSDLKGVFTARK